MAAAEVLITEHIDLWTAAVKRKSSAGRGTSKKLELYGIKKLRELILEMAVRGLLVPQDPDDEPAGVLLERIAAEKAQLVKEGKIKKQKVLPPIEENEKPFNLPSSWLWQRLSDVFYPISVSKNKIKTSEILEAGEIPVVDQGQSYIAGYTNKKELEIVLPGPVVVFGDHTSNIKYIDFNFVAGADGVKILRPITCDDKYFHMVTKFLPIENRGYGRHYSRLTDNLFPLAPISEQHRIVAKVDELMALCDQLEQQTEANISAHQTLVETLLTAVISNDANSAESIALLFANFDSLFTTEDSVDQLKQTILQLAVMGKLVPQDPNDEPASVLLEKIAAEKKKLIKEKKIKKQKALPPISDEEKPFELPVGWELTSLGFLLPEFQNGASSRGDKQGKNIIVVRLADISNWKISLNEPRSLTINESSIKKYSLLKNDVLIIRVNGSSDIVGRFIFCEKDFNAIYCDHFIRMRFPVEVFLPQYLSLLGSSSLIRGRIENMFVSTAGQKTVNQKHIASLVLTLPPIEEQHRIVVKVDELMTLCDQLKTRLNTAQTTQLHLADTVTEQAIV